MIVYQNLAWDGHLSPATYTVSRGGKAHSVIHSGDLHVWVRALMQNGQWSATGAVMVRIQGKGIPQPRPTAHPTPKPTPQIHAGDVLYTANLNTLSGDPGWKHVDGILVNDGSGGFLTLPFKSPVTDYAVEVTFQIISGKNCVFLRTREEAALVTGYYGGICVGARHQGIES